MSRLPSGKALPTSHYDNELVVATVRKNLEHLILNGEFKKKKNCIKNDLLIENPVNVYSLNSITNLDGVKLRIGKNEKLKHIQVSFFAIVLNYVTFKLIICNSNHSRLESCTSSCVPFNLSKIKV